jgi:hypothetical protein
MAKSNGRGEIKRFNRGEKVTVDGKEQWQKERTTQW